jgi:RNA polymerase-binding transcription factor DksA
VPFSTSVPSWSTDLPAPLTSLQRLRARDQLNLLWRLTVDELVELSVELHTFDDDSPVEQVTTVEVRLASARRTLVEVEEALKKLRSGTYGRCDACERRIEPAVLAMRPQHRFCRTCAAVPSGIAT